MRPRNLEALFIPGSRLASGDGRVALITEPAYTGRLRLPTGSVIAADPFFLIGADPFTVTVTPGDHAVLIASMRWEGTDEEGETPGRDGADPRPAGRQLGARVAAGAGRPVAR
ncbi:hypothetical protein AB0C27_50150 [Nonomuraea sp. NPDC048882]|uniref:hypothetical protein n=1 Tax=Nonomuraea sp. NPDC048882 TaxID=3154347 RepID=UPI000ACA0CD9